jgi:hypothetical protein
MCLIHTILVYFFLHLSFDSTIVKPAVRNIQILQIQEVHPVAHFSACNLYRFSSMFLA